MRGMNDNSYRSFRMLDYLNWKSYFRISTNKLYNH